MITNLKIKASPVKAMPMEEVLKKMEAGKEIRGLGQSDRTQFKLEMETDLETCKKVVQYIQELGKMGSK